MARSFGVEKVEFAMLFILWNALGCVLFLMCILLSFRMMKGHKNEQEEVKPRHKDIA
jgi:hypothetical protein